MGKLLKLNVLTLITDQYIEQSYFILNLRTSHPGTSCKKGVFKIYFKISNFGNAASQTKMKTIGYFGLPTKLSRWNLGLLGLLG